MPSAPQASASLRWLVVLNNWTDGEFQALKEWCEVNTSYAILGQEVGENGTPHLQGYFILLRRRRLSDLKNTCSSRAHFEVARGSPQSNKRYCSKDGAVWERGDCPGKPPKLTRDELAVLYKVAATSGGDALDHFADEHPGVIGFNGHTSRRNFLGYARPIDRPSISVEWIWGPPGVGKSREAHRRFPGGFIKEPRTKWWTGYMLESSVIIDDFAPKGIDINHLLRWFDRYKCWVETKGDLVPLHAINFIVTSNFSPEECFKGEDGSEHPQMAALRRRMTVIHMLSFPL
jgi:hypothetical protein